MKKVLLMLFCILTGVQTVKAIDAYVVINNNVLTFYYDDDWDSREGTKYTVDLDPQTDLMPMWSSDESRSSIKKVVFDPSFANVSPRCLYHWFGFMLSLESIEGLNYLNTSEATNMSYMFYMCSSLKSIDVKNFNTSKVEDMNKMFEGCRSLTSMDLSSFDTRNVSLMDCMFCNCSSLTTLNLRKFNTRKITRMNEMFRGCSSLKTIDVSSFNTENVVEMKEMFEDCSSLETLDLSSFATQKVENTSKMFQGCKVLHTIYASKLWDMSGVLRDLDYGNAMFFRCLELVGGAGTVYDKYSTDERYARIDGGPSAPGYFTEKTSYDLYVGGTQVRTSNMADILEDGVFSYDADNNVLSIKGNYNYDHYEGFIINYLPDLTVYVATDATIECKGAAFITMANLTITGPGRLTLRSETDCGIYARSGSCVTLDGINLDAQGEWAISGQPNGEKLLIRNSTIKAVTTSSSYSAICDFTGGITLEGCKITKPVGGKIQGGNIVAADGSVTQEIVIEKDNPYDLNNDGKVSTADIQVIINEMKKPQASQNMMYDLNADGKISTADIQVIINEMKK